ncbi:MAG TPA: hypothetical protein VHU40_09150 [Polyangia bacterium]|nr:hypothetical protein [Polyangia bacterium]
MLAQTPEPPPAPAVNGAPPELPPPPMVEVPPPPPAPAPAPPPVADAPPPAIQAPPPPPAKPAVTSKWSGEIYGFAEFDAIYDTTQSFNEIAGNAIIDKKGSPKGDHDRLNYSARNSRLGFRFKGPESDTVRASGIVEGDFLGNQPSDASNAALINNPTFRIRHMAGKLETPYIDVLGGQYWQLFGWQGFAFPNSVEIMGLPGQVFGRTPQLRFSHAFKTDDITIEAAIATSRSPQRDGGVPDTQAGLKFLINKWKGLRTANSTGTSVDSGGIAVSGVYRKFRVNDLVDPKATNSKNAGGVSVDAFIPVIPATMEDRANALTLTGSYVRGTGIADQFTGLTGGIGYPTLPTPATGSAPTYTPNIDGGLVTYYGAGDLHTIDWQSFLVGLQYYLPPKGNIWISANYSRLNSPNIADFTGATGFDPNTAAKAAGDPTKTMKESQFADGNVFVDVNKAVRFGLEFAWFKQKFVDNSTAKNYRTQLSMFYIF